MSNAFSDSYSFWFPWRPLCLTATKTFATNQSDTGGNLTGIPRPKCLLCRTTKKDMSSGSEMFGKLGRTIYAFNWGTRRQRCHSVRYADGRRPVSSHLLLGWRGLPQHDHHQPPLPNPYLGAATGDAECPVEFRHGRRAGSRERDGVSLSRQPGQRQFRHHKRRCGFALLEQRELLRRFCRGRRKRAGADHHLLLQPGTVYPSFP